VVPLKAGLTKGDAVPGEVPLELRVGHLLRVDGYLDIAILSMWGERRAEIALGMAEASVRGTGPGGPEGPDEELLARLRDLVGEAREYYAGGDFPAAMARMRVAEDLVALRIIQLTGE
jgi:hypothetical protein